MKLRSVFSACSADLQPHPPPLQICALTAEDILFEHSFKATGADCSAQRGTALPLSLWRRESDLLLLHSPRTAIIATLSFASLALVSRLVAASCHVGASCKSDLRSSGELAFAAERRHSFMY
jgi:hypothetical protein